MDQRSVYLCKKEAGVAAQSTTSLVSGGNSGLSAFLEDRTYERVADISVAFICYERWNRESIGQIRVFLDEMKVSDQNVFDCKVMRMVFDGHNQAI